MVVLKDVLYVGTAGMITSVDKELTSRRIPMGTHKPEEMLVSGSEVLHFA